MMAKNQSALGKLIKHIELMQKRQKILIKLHDEYSVERAMANGKENVMSLMLDYANAYLNGEKWQEKMFSDLEGKLDRGHYFNNRNKEKK